MLTTFYDLPTGTQADWVQAIGAIIAAVGLFITLILQWKTSEDQRAFLILEKEKDRRNVTPRFISLEIKHRYSELEINTFMTLIVENTDAHQLSCSTNGFPNIRFLPQASVVLKIGETITLKGRYIREELGGVTFKDHKGLLKFQDIDGREYEQDVYFQTGIKGLPRLVSSVEKKWFKLF